MALNIQPVGEQLLAPYCLIVISSTSALNDSGISELLRSWTNSQDNQFANWADIAKRNSLLLNKETETPFTVTEVYEGTTRWATIFKRGAEHLELSLGLRPQKGNPGHTDVAKDVERIVARLAKSARRRWLFQTITPMRLASPKISSMSMPNRNSSTSLIDTKQWLHLRKIPGWDLRSHIYTMAKCMITCPILSFDCERREPDI